MRATGLGMGFKVEHQGGAISAALSNLLDRTPPTTPTAHAQETALRCRPVGQLLFRLSRVPSRRSLGHRLQEGFEKRMRPVRAG